MKSLLPVLWCIAVMPVATAQVVTIAAWDFGGTYDDGGTGAEIVAPTTDHADYTVTSLFAVGLAPDYQGAGTDIYGWGDWNTTNSIDTTEYIQFSVTPDVAATTFTSLDMYWVREPGSSGGPRRYQIYVSDDGFVSSAIADSKQATIGNSATDGLLSWDLSKESALESISVSTTLTFRIYGWRSGGEYGGMGMHAGDDLVLQGEVVPEPSTYALLIGVFTLLGVWFKKRKALR